MTLLTILEELIKAKTLSEDRKTCLDTLKKIQPQIPNSVIDTKSGILLWGHTNLATTSWLINTHLDVVPGSPKQFSLKIKGDKAWGRGVADVKGCAAILIDQAKKWTGLAIQKKVTFMLVTDEEVGGTSTKAILSTMKDLQGAIFLEPTGLHITTEAKGMMQIKIVAKGVSCHGSRPWEGDNAIEMLARGLVQFRLTQPTPTQETRTTTFNFSQIKGGEAINQVASFAELWCDVRFNPQDNPSDIVTEIVACFPSCEVRVVKCESPINCDKSTKVFESVVRAVKSVSINPLTQFDHGTSDARHATALGIPALVFGPKGGGLHSDHEWVSLKSLIKVQNVLDHWIKNI